MLVTLLYSQRLQISCLNQASMGILSLLMAVYQAEDLNCHLNNYGLTGAMASRCLISLCKYQQTFLRKYPVPQELLGSDPKATSRSRRGGTSVQSHSLEHFAFQCLCRWLAGAGKSFFQGKPPPEPLLESKLCMVRITGLIHSSSTKNFSLRSCVKV